jgi:hypothetical protein
MTGVLGVKLAMSIKRARNNGKSTYLNPQLFFHLVSLISLPGLVYTSLAFFLGGFDILKAILTESLVPFQFLHVQRLIRIEIEFELLKNRFN